MQYRLTPVRKWFRQRRLRFIPTKVPAGGITDRPFVKVGGTFTAKPVYVKIGGTFTEKQMKVKVSGSFVNV